MVSLHSFNSKVEGLSIIEFGPMKKRDKYEFYEINFGFSLGLESLFILTPSKRDIELLNKQFR